MNGSRFAWIGLALLAVSCGGGTLREPARVKPAALREACAIGPGGVTREQALCVAHRAGLRVDDGAVAVREEHTSGGPGSWVVDESCEAHPADCIGIVVSRADGSILDTRYLYVVKEYGSKTGRR